MNRLRLFKVVNAALLVSFAAQAATGIIFLLHMRVPYMKILFKIHLYNGALMVLLALAHIALNWGWIRANLFKR